MALLEDSASSASLKKKKEVTFRIGKIKSPKKKKKKILVYTELPRSAPEESFFGNRYRLKFIMRTSTFFVSEDYMIYGNPRSSHKVDVNDRIMFLSIVEGVFEMWKWRNEIS